MKGIIGKMLRVCKLYLKSCVVEIKCKKNKTLKKVFIFQTKEETTF